MTGALLRRIGEYLYGQSWVSGLAALLRIDERNIRRMAEGRDIPEGVPDQILSHMAGHVARGTNLMEQIVRRDLAERELPNEGRA